MYYMSKDVRIVKVEGLWFPELYFDGEWNRDSVGYETLAEAKENV